MGFFEDSLAASLAAGLAVGAALAVPTWWALRLANLAPGLTKLITAADFAVFFVFVTYILHSGLLA
jgi:formate/nitrite transporter FocA (FNT family)